MPISEQRGRRPSPSGAAVATPVHSRLTVLSGPSGVGKSTVVAELNRTCPGIWISVSVTTRRPRPGEVDGREYHFVDDSEFDRLVADGALLDEVATPEPAGRALLARAAERLRLSARGYHRVLRVARTLADLEGAPIVARRHIAEALSYRRQAPRS